MEEEELNFETDMISVLEDGKPEEESGELGGLPGFVREAFYNAELKRRMDEERWLIAYRNYRGIYGPDTAFSKNEKSRAFVKVTKVKVLASYAQLTDVLFGGHRFPLTVEPSKLPDGVLAKAHMSLNPAAQGPTGAPEATPAATGFRFKVDGTIVPAEVMQEGLSGRFGYLKDLIEPIQDQVKEGPGTTSDTVTFEPAYVAAKKMEKKIHDQLDASHADKHLRHVAFEMALFGTGVMKGPFVVDKEYPKWEIDEAGKSTYKPLIKTVPHFEAVGIWDYYPDPDAHSQNEAEWVIHRHKMSKTNLRALKSRPFFRDEIIEYCIEDGPDYQKKWWEYELDDNANDVNVNRWEVLEFWGYVDTDLLVEFGLKIPRPLKKMPQLNANIWICGNQVIRAVLNPYKPSTIPFYAVPYELNPYSFFGIGVAENMADSQMLMNGFMRMAVDNAALSGNLIFEVDANNLAPGQDLEVYPGKIFIRESGAPGQAIFSTQFQNVSEQNLKMFMQARQLADEATGLPSFSHGQTNVQNTGRTASGMSMLMSAANTNIKTVVKNLDDYLLTPLGNNIFAFNMQFDPDETIKGDLEVIARGTESLMANEVRSQRLMQFLGVVSNPMLAPFAKLDRIVREIAKSLDLDPETIANNMEDAAVQAAILQKLNPMPQPNAGTPMPNGAPSSPPGAVPAEAPPAGAQAGDTQGSGGGTVGTGSVPAPNTPGFTGSPR